MGDELHFHCIEMKNRKDEEARRVEEGSGVGGGGGRGGGGEKAGALAVKNNEWRIKSRNGVPCGSGRRGRGQMTIVNEEWMAVAVGDRTW